LDKLKQVKAELPKIEFFQCDISKTEDCQNLTKWVNDNFPSCNILINNAAIVHFSNFYDNENILSEAREEIETNLMAPIVLSKLFIPIIEKNKFAQIINVTTGLVYSPKAEYPFYNATKAALHSFTQVLRKQLSDKEIKITEVLFPAVDTPWHKGNRPKIAISVQQAVNDMLKELEKDKVEIRVAGVKLLYAISRIAPKFAFKKINSLTR